MLNSWRQKAAKRGHRIRKNKTKKIQIQQCTEVKHVENFVWKMWAKL